MDQLRIDTTHRHTVQDAADYTWAAGTDETERHAFPPVAAGAIPGRAACGRVRWTAAYGKRGSRICGACIASLRDGLRATVAALAAVGIRVDVVAATSGPDPELALGDHHVGIGQ